MIKTSIKYLREVYGELGRVMWPSFSEFVGATIIVLVVVFLCMLYIGFLDFALAKAARYIFSQYAG